MKKIFSKRILIMLSLIIVMGIAAACGNGDDNNNNNVNDSNNNNNNENAANADVDEDITVEVIAKSFQHDFWRAVEAGTEEAAEEFGIDVNFVGPQNELEIAEQVEMINNAINKNPSAIALAALDTSASVDLLNQAMSQEIPIIGFDSGVPDAPEGSIYANASTDNYAAGEVAAEHMYEAIEDKLSGDEAPRIGVVSQELNSLSIIDRTTGFIDKMVELLEANDDVGAGNVAITGHEKVNNDVDPDEANVIIETRVPAELNDAAGQAEAQTLLNKEDLIAIYGSNEFAANAIINADDALSGETIGPEGVIAVGFDSGTLQKEAVKSERFYGAITQDPISIGYHAVELAYKVSIGEEVSDVDTGVVWYDSSNIEDEDVAPLLYD